MEHVFFQKGFRPFFLLGGLFASGLIPWWAFRYDAALTGEPGLEGVSWHSHEMIFGFTGVIGTLTPGMMARVTLGHTGRELRVSGLMTTGFVAITASALIRVFGPWQRADLTATMLTLSAALWSVAFLIYVVVNARALLTPRPDGKPG